jgi:hypothetical protein
MGEKTTRTKTELFEMLAQAVRNTQPQPIVAPQPDLIRDVQPEPKKKRSVPKRARTAKNSRTSTGRTKRHR